MIMYLTLNELITELMFVVMEFLRELIVELSWVNYKVKFIEQHNQYTNVTIIDTQT